MPPPPPPPPSLPPPPLPPHHTKYQPSWVSTLAPHPDLTCHLLKYIFDNNIAITRHLFPHLSSSRRCRNSNNWDFGGWSPHSPKKEPKEVRITWRFWNITTTITNTIIIIYKTYNISSDIQKKKKKLIIIIIQYLLQWWEIRQWWRICQLIIKMYFFSSFQQK